MTKRPGPQLEAYLSTRASVGGRPSTLSHGLPSELKSFTLPLRLRDVGNDLAQHFRTVSGVDGVLQSTAGAWGPPIICARISGSKGTLWIDGNGVHVADRTGTRTLEVPSDLENSAPEPPPAEFMLTTYDHLHAAGFDLAPFTKLFSVMRDRILGLETPDDPAPATFADGVAGQAVLDAIRRSSAERRWVALA